MAIESQIVIPQHNGFVKLGVHFLVKVQQIPQDIATGGLWTTGIEFSDAPTGVWTKAREFGEDEIVEQAALSWTGLESEYQIEAALMSAEVWIRVAVYDELDATQDYPTLPIFLHLSKILALPVD